MLSKQFILYVLIGFIGAAVDFSTFFIMNTFTSIGYIIANTIGSIFGMINNFILNYKYNYKLNSRYVRRFVLFCTIGLSGILGSNLIIFILVEYLELAGSLAKVTTLVVIVTIQYTLNRIFTFRNNG